MGNIKHDGIKLALLVGAAVGDGQQLGELVEHGILAVGLHIQITKGHKALAVLCNGDVQRIDQRVDIVDVADVQIGDHDFVVFDQLLNGDGDVVVDARYHKGVDLCLGAVGQAKQLDIGRGARDVQDLGFAHNGLSKEEGVVVLRNIVVGGDDGAVFVRARLAGGERKLQGGKPGLQYLYRVAKALKFAVCRIFLSDEQLNLGTGRGGGLQHQSGLTLLPQICGAVHSHIGKLRFVLDIRSNGSIAYQNLAEAILQQGA